MTFYYKGEINFIMGGKETLEEKKPGADILKNLRVDSYTEDEVSASYPLVTRHEESTDRVQLKGNGEKHWLERNLQKSSII